jgi:hypothetical protein
VDGLPADVSDPVSKNSSRVDLSSREFPCYGAMQRSDANATVDYERLGVNGTFTPCFPMQGDAEVLLTYTAVGLVGTAAGASHPPPTHHRPTD